MLRLYITVASLVRRIDSRLQSSKTKAGCSLDHYIHLTACESVTVAKAPRGKETRASCSSAKSILAPPRQVSEARKPYNAELKTCVTSVQYSVSETIRSPATLPLYRPWLQRSIRVPTMDGSCVPILQSPSPSSSISPSRFPRETVKPLPPSLDKRLLTAARLHLPVTRLVPLSMFPLPRRLHSRSLASEELTTACEILGLDQTAAMPYFAVANCCP